MKTKKILAMLLAAMFILSLAPMALAADSPKGTKTDAVTDANGDKIALSTAPLGTAAIADAQEEVAKELTAGAIPTTVTKTDANGNKTTVELAGMQELDRFKLKIGKKATYPIDVTIPNSNAKEGDELVFVTIDAKGNLKVQDAKETQDGRYTLSLDGPAVACAVYKKLADEGGGEAGWSDALKAAAEKAYAGKTLTELKTFRAPSTELKKAGTFLFTLDVKKGDKVVAVAKAENGKITRTTAVATADGFVALKLGAVYEVAVYKIG